MARQPVVRRAQAGSAACLVLPAGEERMAQCERVAGAGHDGDVVLSRERGQCEYVAWRRYVRHGTVGTARTGRYLHLRSSRPDAVVEQPYRWCTRRAAAGVR